MICFRVSHCCAQMLAEEGAVVWDCARVLLAHFRLLQRLKDENHWSASSKRILEIGAGTGILGLALSKLGAAQVALTDLPSMLDLLERNVARNAAELHGEVRVLPLCWTSTWQAESDPSLSQRNGWDMILVCEYAAALGMPHISPLLQPAPAPSLPCFSPPSSSARAHVTCSGYALSFASRPSRAPLPRPRAA